MEAICAQVLLSIIGVSYARVSQHDSCPCTSLALPMGTHTQPLFCSGPKPAVAPQGQLLMTVDKVPAGLSPYAQGSV